MIFYSDELSFRSNHIGFRIAFFICIKKILEDEGKNTKKENPRKKISIETERKTCTYFIHGGINTKL